MVQFVTVRVGIYEKYQKKFTFKINILGWAVVRLDFLKIFLGIAHLKIDLHPEFHSILTTHQKLFEKKKKVRKNNS